MSVGRRKSKNPQKCQWENNAPTHDISTDVKEDPTHIEYLNELSNHHVTRDFSETHLASLGIFEFGFNENRVSAVRGSYKNEENDAIINTISETLYDQKEKIVHSGSTKERKHRASPNNEMTVDEVMQSKKEGNFGECRICKISLKDWLSSVEHIQHHRSSFIPPCIKVIENSYLKQHPTCYICEKQYYDKNELVLHARTEHDITKAPYSCVLCGKVLTTLAMLQDHIDLKDVTICCPVCSSRHSHEYDLYSHLSQCLQNFHPHLKYLRCHICDHRISVDDLANHMIQHSFHSHEFYPKREKCSSVSSLSSSSSKSSEIFLCEVCNKKYGSFDEFKDHLSKHEGSKKFCPLCCLKGFVRADFVIRHLLLRCPKRNADQVLFGTTIINLGKHFNQNFLDVLKDFQNDVSFQTGLISWDSFPMVCEFIKSFESFTKEELKKVPELSAAFQFEPGAATDIDLLCWLANFENNFPLKAKLIEKICKNFFSKSKKIEAEAISDDLGHELNGSNTIIYHIETDSKYEERQIAISSKDIVPDCFIKSNMNHRPSLKHFEQKFTSCGVRILPSFDLSRLKKLNDESVKLMEFNPIDDHIGKTSFTFDHFLRLEWEAQFLRKDKPFYVLENKELKRLSPLFKGKKRKPSNFDYESILKLLEESNDDPSFQKQLNRISFGEKDVRRLLAEAQQLNVSND